LHFGIAHCALQQPDAKEDHLAVARSPLLAQFLESA
jgi:hypothetical protein